MAKDDLTLGVEMGRLEIEPIKLNKPIKEENPFVSPSLSLQRRNLFYRTCYLNNKCACIQQRKTKNLPICKRKQNKILKEPVLKLLQINSPNLNSNEGNNTVIRTRISTSELLNSDALGLCSLVDDCNQLRISSSNYELAPSLPSRERNDVNQWWKPSTSCSVNPKEAVTGVSQAGTCSQQALNPPCDVTIDELASYFETLVHIPKKMSSMAEMMYI